MGGFLLARRLDYHLLQRYWWVIAVTSLVLLVAVLVPGVGTFKNGARRWFRFGPIGFQPSELAKPAMLVALCAMVVRLGGKLRDPFRWLLPCMAVIGLASGLVLMGPDFGTAALIGLLGTLLILAAGARIVPIAATGVVGVGAMAFLISRSPTRMARILAFLDPWKHQEGAGYQAIHSLVALGSGGLLGREGMQKLFWLPEADTDFILAIIGEELGLLGTLGVLFIFLLIIRQGMRISEAAPDPFGRLLAFGITAMIASQAIIHIAVVTVSMPTKGIALPFISSGGSALLTSMTAVGVLTNIARQATERVSCGEAACAETTRIERPWGRALGRISENAKA